MMTWIYKPDIGASSCDTTGVHQNLPYMGSRHCSHVTCYAVCILCVYSVYTVCMGMAAPCWHIVCVHIRHGSHGNHMARA